MKVKYATLSRSETFSAAHCLRREDLGLEGSRAAFGRCAGLHGHDYELTVTVRAPLDEEKGVIVNAASLGDLVRKHVVEKVDHRNLNTDVPFLAGRVTSMENLVLAFARELEGPLAAAGTELFSIRLAETPKNSVTIYFDHERVQ